MLLIKLFSRTFITNKSGDDAQYSTIVVKEIPKHLKQGSIIELDKSQYINLEQNPVGDNKGNIKLQTMKVIKKYIYMVRSKRRKRCVRRIGYVQNIGYFKILANK